VITAPAGFGKTTLLAQALRVGSWGPKRVAADADRRDPGARAVAWLTADAFIDGGEQLLRALIVALRELAADLGHTTLALLAEPQRAPLELIVGTLIGDLSACPPGSVLVLDDYHALTDRDVHRAVTLLVEQLPPHVRLVIASREEPPLPLSRWRVRGILAELHAADLRFAPAEAAAFLRDTMGLTLSDPDTAVLLARTEGWAAGLQLAALALQGQQDPAGFVSTFAGNNRLVVDYLSAEVLATVPAHMQEFLLQTSILDQLCGPLCDAILLGHEAGEWRYGDELSDRTSSLPPQAAQSYSQLVLEELERRNLFMTPLDLTRSWYRYHQLFRDVLRQRLASGAAPRLLATLHRRAARWFAAQRSPSLVAPALRHALAAGDDDAAADLLLGHGRVLLRRLDLMLLRDWIALMPPSLVRRHARLALIAGWTLTLTGRLGAAIALLDEAIGTPAPPEVLAEARLIGAMNARLRGDLPAAQTLVAQALPDIDPADNDAGTWAAYLRGFTLLDDDDQDTPRAALEEAVRLGTAAGQLPLALSALSRLALNALRRGQLTAAQACCDRADALVAGIAVLTPAAGLADVLRGVIAYRRDDLVGAQRALLQGIERLRGWIDHPLLVLGMIYQARCLQALGEAEAAQAALARADDWLRQRRIQGPSQALLAVERARLWLRQGRLDEAAQWAQHGLTAGPSPQYAPQQLTLVRLWLAQARAEDDSSRLNQARAILQPLRDTAAARGWEGDLSEIELLEALVLAAQGQNAVAVERLAGVLARAEPEGAVRPIADEGRPAIALLHQVAAAHRPLRRFVQRLLDMYQSADSAPELAGVDTPSALTPRETEVLRLLAVGNSTQTIAAQLVLSPGTVKRHIGNILRKLAVHSRLEAVAQARARGLI
jgi:LuxR family maltose regulon positive regulatory protein